jgi:hypothetical protein
LNRLMSCVIHIDAACMGACYLDGAKVSINCIPAENEAADGPA